MPVNLVLLRLFIFSYNTPALVLLLERDIYFLSSSDTKEPMYMRRILECEVQLWLFDNDALWCIFLSRGNKIELFC